MDYGKVNVCKEWEAQVLMFMPPDVLSLFASLWGYKVAIYPGIIWVEFLAEASKFYLSASYWIF